MIRNSIAAAMLFLLVGAVAGQETPGKPEQKGADQAAAKPAGKPHAFPFAPAKGTTARFKLVTSTTQEVNLPPESGMGPVTTGQARTLTFELTSEGADDKGTVTLKLKILTVKGSSQNPMTGDEEWDSEKDSSGDKVSLASKILTSKVDRTGKVLEVTGHDPDDDWEAKELVKDAVGYRPRKDIAVGESCDLEADQLETRPESAMNLTGTITLKETGDPEAKFAVECKLAIDPEKAKSNPQMAGAKIKSQKLEGKQSLSVKDCLPVSVNMKMDMSLNVENPMGSLDVRVKASNALSRL